jgi:uncharacterized membrane protein
MDLGLLAACVMLVVWAVGAFVLDAPGWIHALLTIGVFVLVWRITARASARRMHATPHRDDPPLPR